MIRHRFPPPTHIEPMAPPARAGIEMGAIFAQVVLVLGIVMIASAVLGRL